MHIMLPRNSGITLIDGTYAGYIFELSGDGKQACILYNDKCYVFTFIGEDYFRDEYIYELLDTIVIESIADDEDRFIRTYNKWLTNSVFKVNN